MIDCKWTKPPVNSFKINTNASLGSCWYAGGVAIRDCHGELTAAFSYRSNGIIDSILAEAMAIRYGLSSALSLGISNVLVESDCQSVIITSLSSQDVHLSPLGLLIDDISSLASLFTSCTFTFIPRHCDRVAHALAKLRSSVGSSSLNMALYPPNIVALISTDLE